MKACFMGLGYIGLPTAVVAARNGIQVHGCDINPDIVEKTMKGELHFEEPVLGDYLMEAVSGGTLKAAVAPEISDTYVIVVPTPFKENHEPDIKYVQSASLMVLPLLKEGDLFIIESTSPVGTTDFIAKMIFEKRPELKGKIYIAYCPERVLPGNIVYELEHNDRVIGGIDNNTYVLTEEGRTDCIVVDPSGYDEIFDYLMENKITKCVDSCKSIK